MNSRLSKQSLQQARSLPALAAYYSDRLDITVSMKGESAYTDGKNIIIPDFLESSQGMSEAFIGFLAHESAHVKYSNFSALRTIKDSITHGFANILEDIRIETLLSKSYPRAFASLGHTAAYLRDRGMLNFETRLPLYALALSYVLLFLRVNRLHNFALAELLEKYEADFRKRFPEALGAVRAVADKFFDSVRSTEDAVKLAEELVQLLAFFAPPPEDKKSINKISRIVEQLAPRADSLPQQEGHRLMSAKPNSGASQDIRGLGLLGGKQQEFSAISALGRNKSNIKSDARECPENIIHCFDEELDGEEVSLDECVLTENAENIQGSEEFLNRNIGRSARFREVLKRFTENASVEKDGFAGAKGRIIPRKLHRLCFGKTDIFGAKHIVDESNDTAVHILCDISGSMARLLKSRNKDWFGGMQRRARWIDAAEEATWSIASAMEGIEGVRREVSFFPGFDQPVMKVLSADEKAIKCAGKFMQSAHGNTPTDQALIFAAKELLKSECGRRVAIVVTDGCPENESRTMKVLNLMKNKGIEVFAIGMGGDFVSRIFDRYSVVRIDDMHGLRRELFRVVTELLANKNTVRKC